MAELQHKFVTELEQAEKVLSSDYILLSQKDETDSEYMSRKLPYSKLCATVLNDIDDKISSSVSAAISVLTLSVERNISAISAISALSAGLAETTSAVIKIANCVQQNKASISAIGSVTSSFIPLKNIDISGLGGINVQRVSGTYKWNVKHANEIAAATAGQFARFKYDANGHITGASAVTSSDVTGLGHFLTEAGTGLSRSDHTVSLKTATSAEIGGVKVNGNNVSIASDGTLSASDTLYTAGTGLSKSASNQFSLVQASASQLGGIRVGANLSVSNGILSAAYVGPATETSAGTVELGYSENGRNYAVKTAAGNKAYVTVPWTDTSATFDTGTRQLTDQYSVISAISYGNGNVTGISASLALYSLISAISAHVEDVGGLSDCIQVTNGRLTYDTDTGELALAGGVPLRNLTLGGTDIPTVISGEVVTSSYTYDGEGHQVVTEGLFIKLGRNTSQQQADDIYVDVEELKDTVVESVTYDHATRKIVIRFNDVSKSNISVYIGDLVDTYTAGTGLSCSNNQFYIPKTETWTFTLDDKTQVTKTVALI